MLKIALKYIRKYWIPIMVVVIIYFAYVNTRYLEGISNLQTRFNKITSSINRSTINKITPSQVVVGRFTTQLPSTGSSGPNV